MSTKTKKKNTTEKSKISNKPKTGSKRSSQSATHGVHSKVASKKKKQAMKRVKEIKGFYQHLAIFVVVNIFLIGINLLERFSQGEAELWFIFPTVGWGIGLAAHAFSVYGGEKFFGEEWEQKKLRELIGK